MQSFHNDPAVKAEIARRLQAHRAGDVSSPAARMADDPNLSVFQQRLGIPKAFGGLIDTIAASLGTAARATQFAEDWLGAAPVGSDLHGVAHAVLLWLLTDPEHGLVRHATSDAERQMIDRVAALHRRSRSGEVVDARQWRDARTAAMAATDSLQGGMQKAVGHTIEAAAWDPASSGTVLADTARNWMATEGQAAPDRISSEEDRAIRARLKGLFEDAKASGAASERIDVFKLLEQHHPAEAAELRKKIAAQREQANDWAVALGAVLIDFTKRAASPDALERAG
jgi:hypothetical protein